MSGRRRFTVLDSLCAPGAWINEDRATALSQAAWVLDGTTGHHPVRLFPGPTDAAWFAETADRLLRDRAAQATDGATLLEDLVHSLIATCQASALVPLDSPDIDKPAASLALVRFADDALEYVMLGDCKLLLRAHNGAVEALDHSQVAAFDAGLVAALRDMQAAGETDLAKSMTKLRPMILANRRRKNRLGGYGVLADDPACSAFADIGRRPAATITHVLLASDGFYRLVDAYRTHTSATLVHDALSGGLSALYAQLRGIEDADAQCLTYPRLKARDDAAALLLHLESL
jgi:hypothetical protein